MNNLRTSMLLIILITGFSVSISAKTDHVKAHRSSKKILIIGLNDNIKSDYYYKELISEESGIPSDSLERVFNQTIATHLIQSSDEFSLLNDIDNYPAITNNIRVDGEKEKCSSNLSMVDSQQFKDFLEETGADYLLILNRYYLKKQEEPFNTLFYFISYSLYNKDKKELATDANYFTTMKVETPVLMKKASRKASEKMATSILKLVAQDALTTQNNLLTNK